MTVDTSRVSAGRRAIHAERDRLAAIPGGPADVERGADLYAARVLEADDEQARVHGWVGRADGVRWTDLVAIATAAADQLDAEHQGQHVKDCPACDLRRAVGRVRESTRTAIRAGVRLDGSATVGDDGGSASY